MLGMNDHLSVLIHGAGWVSTQHIAAFQANPHTRVVAVCSRTREGALRRIRESGLRDVAAYDDFGEALRHPGVDMVSVCTPQHPHCANVAEAARAGKHFWAGCRREAGPDRLLRHPRSDAILAT